VNVWSDPITAELMQDPVILPSSNNTMDRAAITRHLLSNSTDPFNRAHLTIDMLQPSTAPRLAPLLAPSLPLSLFARFLPR
jgi:hypothetical protein